MGVSLYVIRRKSRIYGPLTRRVYAKCSDQPLISNMYATNQLLNLTENGSGRIIFWMSVNR